MNFNNTHPRTYLLLTLFFGLALVTQIGYLLVGLASNPAFYRRVTTQSVEPAGLYGQVVMSNQIIAQEAAERGLSLEQYAIYRIVFNSVVALIPAAVALLIIWRAGRQWFAWFTAFIILFLGEYSLGEQTTIARLISQELFGTNAIFWFLVLLFFFLFPNGQIVPRRAGWIVIGLVVYHFFIQVGTVLAYITPELAARYNLPNWGNPIFIAPVLLNFLIILACQTYRYRRVSSPIERQQTKWFLLGFGVIVAFIPVSMLTGNRGGFLDDMATVALYTPLPVSLAFAILRYRLWDIDILIRRTLVYSILTALLALAYFGSVVVLESLTRRMTGAGSAPFVTVLSTLLIAALFSPMRQRIQSFIDRRFYRQKYDAERVLVALSTTLRDEVDLDRLKDTILGVVEETMQPAHVSLWLRDVNFRQRERQFEDNISQK